MIVLSSPAGRALLDLVSGLDDGHGGVLLRLDLLSDSIVRTECPPLGPEGERLPPKRYRHQLAAPVVLYLRLDLSGIYAMASRAARSKSGKCKSGPVTIRGGRGARYERGQIE